MGTARVICAAWLLTACGQAARGAEPDAGPPWTADAGAHEDAAVPMEARIGEDYWAWSDVPVPESGIVQVRFALPQEARSFVLTATSARPAYIALMALIGPEGEVLFDRRTMDNNPFEPAARENLEDPFPLSVLFPSASGLSVQPGTYTARLGVLSNGPEDDAQRLDVDVVWQRATNPRRLRLNLWLAPDAPLSPDALARDPTWTEGLSQLRTIFTSAGIELDPLEVSELDGALGALDALDEQAGLVALRQALEQERTEGLDVVLVARIAAEGRTVRGKTSGIPGPPAHPELRRRGMVVLSLEALPNSPLRLAEAIAHEVGHYLGLRHTTEMDGSRHDDLADTPECPYELASFRSASGVLLLSAEDCADYDGTNLLFAMPPLGLTGQQGLSELQATVMRSHPLVR
jgi:hypothetical protein